MPTGQSYSAVRQLITELEFGLKWIYGPIIACFQDVPPTILPTGFLLSSRLAIMGLPEPMCSLSMDQPNGGQDRVSWELRSRWTQTTQQNEYEAGGFKVFPPPLCHRVKYKRACHTCARSSGPPDPHAKEHGPHPRENSSPVDCRFWFSFFDCQQLRSAARIIIHFPRIRQRFVSRLEILPTTNKPSHDIRPRHVMPTLFDAGGDAVQQQWQ